MPKDPIEIIPDGEDKLHQKGQFCVCGPVIEPGESMSIAHRSLTPHDDRRPVRRER